MSRVFSYPRRMPKCDGSLSGPARRPTRHPSSLSSSTGRSFPVGRRPFPGARFNKADHERTAIFLTRRFRFLLFCRCLALFIELFEVSIGLQCGPGAFSSGIQDRNAPRSSSALRLRHYSFSTLAPSQIESGHIRREGEHRLPGCCLPAAP